MPCSQADSQGHRRDRIAPRRRRGAPRAGRGRLDGEDSAAGHRRNGKGQAEEGPGRIVRPEPLPYPLADTGGARTVLGQRPPLSIPLAFGRQGVLVDRPSRPPLSDERSARMLAARPRNRRHRTAPLWPWPDRQPTSLARGACARLVSRTDVGWAGELPLAVLSAAAAAPRRTQVLQLVVSRVPQGGCGSSRTRALGYLNNSPPRGK
jgi:hypothetical protein